MKHNGRAWNHKLSNIDALLMWMYDQDILNKGEKKKKDSVFYRYYRYYNDGDCPRGMGLRNKAEIEKYLEDGIEDFSRTILKKYKGKYSRKQFRNDQFTEQTEFLVKLAHDNEFHSLTKYWVKDCKDVHTVKMIKSLEIFYDAATKVLNNYCDEFGLSNLKNMTMSYTLKQIEEKNGKIPKDLQIMVDFLEKMMLEINISLRNLLRK